MDFSKHIEENQNNIIVFFAVKETDVNSHLRTCGTPYEAPRLKLNQPINLRYKCIVHRLISDNCEDVIKHIRETVSGEADCKFQIVKVVVETVSLLAMIRNALNYGNHNDELYGTILEISQAFEVEY